jgi:nucleoside-diphosphate-sugar epimerase
MKIVAVLGANGFIGSRIIEMLHVGNLAKVRPVVRTAASAARLSRFDLDCRVADALDPHSLAVAFSGCDVVVHAVAGSPEVILGAPAPVFQAAQQAGVQRLIYLSSASVHGQAPEPGTNEASRLGDRQPLPYNNAKVRAEGILRKLHNQSDVELVILRPGIVFGPRSFWVGSFADALLAGEAYLIGDGKGICNSIYVDNLVHAIHLATTVDEVNGEAFLLGDDEQVTWSDLYRPVAEALGFDLNDVPRVPAIVSPKRKNHLRSLRSSSPVRAVLSVFPPRLRQAVSAGVSSLRRPVYYHSPWELPSRPTPQATLEMSLLYSCCYKLPHNKAKRLLRYEPLVSFNEGCRRTVGWMGFAGYPLSQGSNNRQT